MTRTGRDCSGRPAAGGTADRLVFEVPSRPEHIASARHAVVAFLAQRGVPSVVVDDLELVVSELVTNAIIHPRGASDRAELVAVAVEVSEDVLIAVSNVGPAAAIPPLDAWLPAPPMAPSGRGLGIVRRLCDDVAVEQDGDRTIVRGRRHLPDGGATP